MSTTIALGIMSMSAKVTHFDYSNYEFKYTDGGIEKTAKLTDEATTTSHMIALLKALGKIEYNLFASIAPWIKGANETYSDPYDDGMTLLLVQMKDGWY